MTSSLHAHGAAPPSAVRRRVLGCTLVSCLLGVLPLAAAAEKAGAPAQALVAVAANFAEVVQRLQPLFEAQTGHRLLATTGSTGKLYAQISAGAPFDVLLSADTATPARLAREGNAISGSRFTYAVGRLALWSASPGVVASDGSTTLKAGAFRHLAIANPDLAPYGVAARQVLQATGMWAALQPRLVMGQNIGQTHSMVATGAAELGFVALSAVQRPGVAPSGSRWLVPQALYAPLQQDAVLLRHGAANPAARAWLAFLRTPAAQQVIEAHGYGLE
jgi:molybdate transport system substrate-binding protein